MAAEGLKNKTVKGVAWSAIDNIAQFGVTFIVGIILARLLTPDDYGLVGIITIFTNICRVLINYGLTSSLIRKKNATEDDYNTIFVINLVMSVGLYLILFLCSPIIAKFFAREELVLLARVSSLSLIIGALALVQQTRLTKRIDFKTQTKITMIASISSGIVGISMALLGCGVWALVVQGLVSTTMRTLFLWIYNHWSPRLRFSKSSFKELFGFGWKLIISSLLDGVWKELYQVVVAKFYSPATLGQYTKAKHFSQLFSNNLTEVIQRVSYPVLSDIQDDKNKMVSVYRRLIKTTMYVTLITMFALGAISEPLLYCLIGPKWQEAATFLPLICISGSFYPLQAINLNMLQVQGRSDLFLGLEIIKKIISVLPLCVGIFVGIIPMLYLNIATSIINYFLNSFYSGKLIGYSTYDQLKDIAPSYGIAILIALPMFFMKFLPMSNWVILPLQFLVGVIVFWGTNRLFKSEEYENLKHIIIGLINNKIKS